MPNGRLGSRKTTTGCITCRIRKIKCDEHRPHCMKCVKTGRKCDGYTSQFKIGNSAVTRVDEGRNESRLSSPSFALTDFAATRQERRSLAYFRAEVAPALSGLLEEDFWNGHVLKLAHHEPLIRDSIYSISCLYGQAKSCMISHDNRMATLGLNQSAGPGTRESVLATQYYSKAINATRTLVEANNANVNVLLLSCILFICIESLLGDAQEALDIYQRGYNILSTLALKGEKTIYGPVFGRLRVLAALMGRSDDSKGVSVAVSYFASHSEVLDMKEYLPTARTELFDLMYAAHSLIRRFLATEQRLDQADRELLDEIRLSLLMSLHQWESQFISMKARLTTQSELHHYHTLVMYCKTTIIWLSAVMDFRGECAFDDHIQAFESIIDSANHLTKDFQSSQPVFAFEMGIIPPLYFTAARCRDLIIRRKALALLRQHGSREGLWDSRQTASAAEAIIEVEEQAMGLGQRPSAEKRVRDAVMPSYRIPTMDGRNFSAVIDLHFRSSDGVVHIMQKSITIR